MTSQCICIDSMVYETCACVIHTINLLSYMCIIVISHKCLRGVHVLREALVHKVLPCTLSEPHPFSGKEQRVG